MPRLSRYSKIVQDLGAKVLDIYRYKDKDVLRVYYRGKIKLIDLQKHREEMDLETFKEIVKKALT
jgi:hypothetical protein